MSRELSGSRRTASTALLVLGYPLSVLTGARLLSVLRERRTERFLAMEAGIGCVTAGLVLRRRWLPAAANGVTGMGLAVVWLASGRWLRSAAS